MRKGLKVVARERWLDGLCEKALTTGAVNVTLREGGATVAEVRRYCERKGLEVEGSPTNEFKCVIARPHQHQQEAD